MEKLTVLLLALWACAALLFLIKDQIAPPRHDRERTTPDDTPRPRPDVRQHDEYRFPEGDPPRNSTAYNEYMHSAEWDQIREKVLKRASHTCEQHKHGQAKVVKHSRWPKEDRWGNFHEEPDLSNLIAVCPDCSKQLWSPSDWDDPDHPMALSESEHRELREALARRPDPQEIPNWSA